MTIPGSANPLLLRSAAPTAYQVSRSLRFNSSDSAYLSRTPASAGNRKTWTWAGWVKRSSTDSDGAIIFSSSPSAGANTYICFAGSNSTGTTADAISLFSAPLSLHVGTAAVFRDFAAWFHLVVAVDTTQGTAANRVRIYVNGAEVTYANTSYPTSSQDLGINAAYSHTIGTTNSVDSWAFFNGYLADIHFIDGQALTPSSFTEVSATTGQLIPKAYTGTFGTNGFWLKFSDNSAATATTLGKDYSSNGNNWTPNNLSVTAGAGNDSLVDTPTSYGTDDSLGGSVRGNYATLNPLDKGANVTLTNGNLDVSTASTWNSVRATFALTSGKWYWEYTMTAAGYTMIGIGTSAISLAGYIGQSSAGYAFYSLNGNKWNAGSAASYGSSFTTNDVIGVAFDADAGKIWFAKNGTWQASGDPAAGTNAAYSSIPSGTYFPTISQDNSLPAATGGSLNAGARPFAYTAPSGFKALCDTNLPTPVVAKPNTVMDVALYTGTGSALTATSALGFSPDFVWIKGRSGATDHALYDAVRGATLDLVSNSTAAETTQTQGLTAFNSNGFSVGTLAKLNTSSSTYVGWCWDAGSSTVTNTQGSITSQVRANTSAGFSIVSYTGNATAGATVGHGLNAPLGLYIIKNRDTVDPWIVFGSAIDSTGSNGVLILNSTAARSTSATTTATTSTTFPLSQYPDVNGNGQRIVAYCFSPVAGYSSFGSYTGNGSTDGTFVYTGFRPRFVLLKNTTNASWWQINDAARNPYNLTNLALAPNQSDQEYTYTSAVMDILSNGFKLRGSDNYVNASSNTYIYAAFAEHPFQYARAR